MPEISCCLPPRHKFGAQENHGGINPQARWCQWHHLPRTDPTEGAQANYPILSSRTLASNREWPD